MAREPSFGVLVVPEGAVEVAVDDTFVVLGAASKLGAGTWMVMLQRQNLPLQFSVGVPPAELLVRLAVEGPVE